MTADRETKQPIHDFRLRCTFCGGPLHIEMSVEGYAYMSYDIPDSIECWDCSASWSPSGELRLAPYKSDLDRALRGFAGMVAEILDKLE